MPNPTTARQPFAVTQRSDTEVELQYARAQIKALETMLKEALSEPPLLEGDEVVEILPNRYEQAAAELGTLVADRNRTYGNSFAKTGEFLRLLYGEAISADRFNDALLLVRMFDKQMRSAAGHMSDSYRDIAGYALLGHTQTNTEQE